MMKMSTLIKKIKKEYTLYASNTIIEYLAGTRKTLPQDLENILRKEIEILSK